MPSLHPHVLLTARCHCPKPIPRSNAGGAGTWAAGWGMHQTVQEKSWSSHSDCPGCFYALAVSWRVSLVVPLGFSRREVQQRGRARAGLCPVVSCAPGKWHLCLHQMLSVFTHRWVSTNLSCFFFKPLIPVGLFSLPTSLCTNPPGAVQNPRSPQCVFILIY